LSGNIEAAITKVATRVGVERSALERLVWNESRGNIAVGMDVSNYSAGIGQISRRVWSHYSTLPYSDAANPRYYMENLTVAAQYLHDMHSQFGDWRTALAAYNSGPGVIQQVLAGKRNLSYITQRYIAGVND
jgi:hypothetical protein